MSVLGAIASGVMQPECELSGAKLLATQTGCRWRIHCIPHDLHLGGYRLIMRVKVMVMVSSSVAEKVVTTATFIAPDSASARS